MNEDKSKKKLILKVELFSDGTSVTEQDLVGLMQYLQMITAEGSKTVDVITGIITKVVISLNKKVAETDEAVELARAPGKLGELKKDVNDLKRENAELTVKANNLLRDTNSSAARNEQLEDLIKDQREEIDRLKAKIK